MYLFKKKNIVHVQNSILQIKFPERSLGDVKHSRYDLTKFSLKHISSGSFQSYWRRGCVVPEE